MGFCLFNNIAIAAASLAGAGERVAVIDFDVHHGNGTQEIFWDDDRVLYVSTHQSPYYPGTGAASEVGGPHTLGATVNIPLPAGATGDVVVHAFDEVVAPAIESFGPTFVLVSAGFDAHRADPLADLDLSAGDFGLLGSRVAGYAPAQGRLLLFLEGGYDRDAVELSVAATLARVMGVTSASERPTSGGPGGDRDRGGDPAPRRRSRRRRRRRLAAGAQDFRLLPVDRPRRRSTKVSAPGKNSPTCPSSAQRTR